ncbi:hypothetical protein ILYODFUR_033754 [Ilyodon furcidens]|uniref:Uncharacterized protein n=1 Tax=Ilyodon furcidens TaxID=33524 RepID=A0ABV0U2U5_9TELE
MYQQHGQGFCLPDSTGARVIHKQGWGEIHLFVNYCAIISSKDSENLEKSLHVSGNGEKQHRMSVIFDSSGGTALKTDIFL